jgi:hypothetical protein
MKNKIIIIILIIILVIIYLYNNKCESFITDEINNNERYEIINNKIEEKTDKNNKIENICFIISHKYYRTHTSFIKLYVDNIQKFYSESLILICDNNSKYFSDIKDLLKDYNNIVFIDNNTACKFEIGAYNCGINYIKNNNILDKYEYYVFTQDNFIINKKYDFNNLVNNNVTACTINTYYQDGQNYDVFKEVLTSIGLFDNLDKITFCYASSFILHKSKVINFMDITKNIVIINRYQSCACERYLARILYELNNHMNFDIDGDIRNLKYNGGSVDFNSNINSFFVKKLQQKTETTNDN